MKKRFNKVFLGIVSLGLIVYTSCNNDDGGEPTPEFAKPTISITSPEIPASGIETETGMTTTFAISVAAEAGLSSVKVGETTLKTFSGTETSGEVNYDYVPLEAGTVTLTFYVDDALGESATLDVLVNVAEGEDLGYVLIDFAGAQTASEVKTVADWDVRNLFTFNVTGSHGTSATAEAVNKQAELYFAQNNPSADDNSKVFELVKVINDTAIDNWGGWAHIIFNLGTAIPEAIINALPGWDNANTATVPGTKVIKVDVYYDATVDPNVTWDTITSRTGVWNADPTLGYKFDLCIASYDPMGTTDGGHDGAFYVGYATYLSTPNQWVTLTFDEVDLGRTAHMYGVDANAPGPDAVNCVKILPAPGYGGSDKNPLYLKNLRIVDVE